MFKFLRKYNKWILAVGGGLLMIVFLLGDTLPRLTGGLGAATATRATVGPDGRERVPARLWAQYDAEAGFIRAAEARVGEPVLPVGKVEGTEHWFLLVREAQQAGLVSEPGSIHVSEEALFGLSQQGIALDSYRQYAANMDGVLRLFDLYLNAGETSDHRLRNFASRVFHKVDAEVAVIPASDDRPDIMPIEEQLAEHLQRYGDDAPGEGPMGLGYKLPDRVKIEWLEITAESVREAIAASDEMDGVALRYHWRRDPHGTFPPFEAGAPIPLVVREDLLNQLTNERLERIVNSINAQLSTSRRGLDQREGYFVLPEEWQERRVALPQLAQEIQQRHEVPLPSYHAIGDRWMMVEELDALEGIGTASTDRFGAPRGLRDLARAAKEFGGSTTVIVQSGLAGPPLRGDNDDIYVFRILEADPSRAPASVDEVREQLVADFRRIAAYDELVERADAFREAAKDRGMLSLALEYDAELATSRIELVNVELARLFARVGQPPRIMPTPLPVIGQHRETVEVIIDHARSLPGEIPLVDLPVEDRILVIPVEDHLAVAIVRITGQEPLSRETYTEVAAEGLVQQLMFAEELQGVDHLQAAFSLETLTKKHNLRVQRARDVEDDVIELGS